MQLDPSLPITHPYNSTYPFVPISSFPSSAASNLAGLELKYSFLETEEVSPHTQRSIHNDIAARTSQSPIPSRHNQAALAEASIGSVVSFSGLR